MSPRKRLRPVWLQLHRWLGLLLGAWFVLLGVTGSLLVFYVDLEPAFDASVAPRPATAPVSVQAVVQALETAHPERRAGWRIELPAPGEALVTARYLRPQETAGRAFAPLLVSVDANKGQVVASRLWGDTAMTWLYDLHYTLLLDSIGRQAVALAGVALVLSAASGLWLWWPAAGHWQQALRFKRVQALWPQAQSRWLDVPGRDDPESAFRARVRLPGEPGNRFPATLSWLDARSGAVLATRTPTDFGGADVFHQWLHPLHSGDASGLAGRIAVCASGVLPLLLVVTGWLRWQHKRRARCPPASSERIGLSPARRT